MAAGKKIHNGFGSGPITGQLEVINVRAGELFNPLGGGEELLHMATDWEIFRRDLCGSATVFVPCRRRRKGLSKVEAWKGRNLNFTGAFGHFVKYKRLF